MANLRWDGDDFRNPQDSSGATAGLISRSGKLQQGYRHGSLTEGLVGYYPFDGDVEDYALGNDGTDNTDSGYGSGEIGSEAKNFDGNDDYILVNGGLQYDGGSFTASAWVKTTDSGWNSILTQAKDDFNGNTSIRFVFSVRDSKAFIEVDDDSTLTTLSGSTTVNDGNWHHLVGVRDNGDELRIYVDGSLDGTTSDDTDPIPEADGDASVGAAIWDDNYLGGSIDDLRFYQRILSLPEIKALYQVTGSSKVSPGDTLQ
jgi:hypothetical protein